MKKADTLYKCRKSIFLALLVLICILMLPVKADAAKLDKTSFILLKGKTATVSLKKYPKKTKKFAWKRSGKAVKIIQKKKGTVKVKAMKLGTSVLKIKSGNKTLKCKVTVISSCAKTKLDQGSGTTLELGKKVKKVISSNPEVVKVSKKGTTVKLAARSSGKAQIVATTAGGSVTKLVINVPARKENTLPDKPGETGDLKQPETEPAVNPETNPETEPETPGNGEEDKGDYWLVKYGTDIPIYDGDTIYYSNVYEYEDERMHNDGEWLNFDFVKETDMRQITWKLENNEDEDGNMIFYAGMGTTDDSVHSFISIGFVLVPLHAGEADFTVSDGTNTATFHLVTDSGAQQRARYYEWLRAMVTTDLGEEKDITVYGETIHVDGVKGRDDAETIANLAIWVADHKIYTHNPIASELHAYKESWLGSECGALNSILTDATCVMGHMGWLTLDDMGHTDGTAVIDGWVWALDVGGAGATTPRGLQVSGLNFDQNMSRIWWRHVSGTGANKEAFWTYCDDWEILDENGNWIPKPE